MIDPPKGWPAGGEAAACRAVSVRVSRSASPHWSAIAEATPSNVRLRKRARSETRRRTVDRRPCLVFRASGLWRGQPIGRLKRWDTAKIKPGRLKERLAEPPWLDGLRLAPVSDPRSGVLVHHWIFDLRLLSSCRELPVLAAVEKGSGFAFPDADEALAADVVRVDVVRRPASVAVDGDHLQARRPLCARRP